MRSGKPGAAIKVATSAAAFGLLAACGSGGGSGSGGGEEPSSSPGETGDAGTLPSAISGAVKDEAVEGATVTARTSSGKVLGTAQTGASGEYQINVSSQQLNELYPPEDSQLDGPRGAIWLTAEKEGRQIQSAVSFDRSSWDDAYVTNDTDAYIRYRRALGTLNPNDVTQFVQNLDQGRVEGTDVTAKPVVESLKADVRSYFMEGGTEPSPRTVFSRAQQALSPSQVAQHSGLQDALPADQVVAGGEFSFSQSVNLRSSTCGATQSGDSTIRIPEAASGTCYANVVLGGDRYGKVAVDVATPQKTIAGTGQVTRSQSSSIGNNQTELTVPAYAVEENTDVTVQSVQTEGETEQAGRPVVSLEPDGQQFQVPATLRIHYPDYGIEDPSSAQWSIGSTEQGWDSVQVARIDRENQDVYLKVTHFSDIAVKELKGQDYLELDQAHAVVIPRRNHRTKLDGLVEDPIGSEDPFDYHFENEGTQVTVQNKIFEGDSVSTRVVNAHDDDDPDDNQAGQAFNGGQCTAFAHGFYQAFKFDRVLRNDSFHSGQKWNGTDDARLRQSLENIQTGDILALTPAIYGGVGHVSVIFDKSIEGNGGRATLKVVESNDEINVGNIPHGNSTNVEGCENWVQCHPYGQAFSHKVGVNRERVITEEQLNATKYVIKRSPSDSHNNVADGGNASEEGDTFKRVYSRVYWDEYREDTEGRIDNSGDDPNTSEAQEGKIYEAPWLYYNVDQKYNGLTINNSEKLTYAPHLLTVLPGVQGNRNTINSRVEIYVSEDFSEEQTFKTDAHQGCEGQDCEDQLVQESGNTIRFPESRTIYDGDAQLQKFRRLKLSKKNQEGSSTPSDGLAAFNVNSHNFNLWAETNNPPSYKGVLFSPTVIDDQYVKYSPNITQLNNGVETIKVGASGSNTQYPRLRIGFSYYGSDGNPKRIEESQIKADNPNSMSSAVASEFAVGGSYTALGANEAASWRFALAGEHQVWVHLPDGQDPASVCDTPQEINGTADGTSRAATYTLHNADIYNAQGQGEYQRQKDLKVSQDIPRAAGIAVPSGYSNWYRLHYEDSEGQARYRFKFTGDEYLNVSSQGASCGDVPVDAIRLFPTRTVADDGWNVTGNVDVTSGMQGVTVQFYRGDRLIKSLELGNSSAESDGATASGASLAGVTAAATQESVSLDYRVTDLAPGDYRVVYSAASGEVQPAINQLEITADDPETIQLPSVTLGELDRTRDVTLQAKDATNANPVSGATVRMVFGGEADPATGSADFQAQSGSNGTVTFTDVPYGTYSVLVNKDGYSAGSHTVDVNADTADPRGVTLSPQLAAEEVRIVLTWGENPSDLDSHLIKRKNGEEKYEIAYYNMSSSEANLDVDDTTSYGPETVTVSGLDPDATYRYYVHDYSSYSGDTSTSLANSGVSVEVFYGDRHETYYIPDASGTAWKVFEIDQGTLNACSGTSCVFGVSGDEDPSMGTFAGVVREGSQGSRENLFQNLPPKR